MDLNFKEKYFIVTGGTKGIGGAITNAIADEGGIPIFLGRTESTGINKLEELKGKGQTGHFIQCDLSVHNAAKEAIEKVKEITDTLQGLVNNAGRNDGVGLENGSPDAFAKSVQSNLNHYYEMAYHCLPLLKKAEHSSILNISSKVAFTGQTGTSGYAAAKAAQLGLTREWAAELLPYGIRVNAILPAEVMTPLYRSWLDTQENPDEKQAQIEKNIPLYKRMTTSEEIAATAVFTLSEKASHTTGQFLSPDGGYLHLDRTLT